MMKVILQEDVQHLGVVGELVTVRDGYGRNFLIPQGKAVHASPRSVKELEHQKRLAAHRRELATAQARSDKDKIEAMQICLTARVAPPPTNEDGEPMPEPLPKLFGSVTNRDLAAVLRESGFKVEHRRVAIAERVHTVGKFFAQVRLDGGVIAKLPFWVVPEGSEDVEAAKAQVEAGQAEVKRLAEEAAEAEAEKLRAMNAPVVTEAAAEQDDDDADEDSDGDEA
jgi:large subunit ribosomal protein L9